MLLKHQPGAFFFFRLYFGVAHPVYFLCYIVEQGNGSAVIRQGHCFRHIDGFDFSAWDCTGQWVSFLHFIDQRPAIEFYWRGGWVVKISTFSLPSSSPAGLTSAAMILIEGAETMPGPGSGSGGG